MNAAQKKEIAKLRKMKLNELQARFQEATGESTRCPNRKYLIRRIEEAIAEPAPEPPPADEVTRRPSQLEQQEEAAEAGPAASSPSPKGGRFGSLTIDELRARYHEIVGRPTGSHNKGYVEPPNMWSRDFVRRVLPRRPLETTPHNRADFSGRMTLRFPRPEACMATGAASWRTQGERA